MRALPLLLALLPAAGCISGDKGAVLLHLHDQRDVALPPTYGSSTAGVGPIADGVLFTATSSQGLLQVLLDKPLHGGDTLTLPANDERVHFELGDAAWGNQGGTVYVISADPAIIGLIGVPMVASSGTATGSFVFDGNGTFRCADSDCRPLD